MNPRSLLAVLCTTVGVLLCGAPAAHAACTSSTPSNVTVTDPADDVEGTAPDLTELKFSVDAACTFAFDPGLSGLTLDDAVVTYIDRDGNAATGDTDFFGTDVSAITVSDGTDSLTQLYWWNGADWVSDESQILETAPSPGGFSVALDRLGIPSGATPNILVGVIRLVAGEFVGIDIAPNSDPLISLAVNYTGTPVVPTFPPPTTTPPTDDPTPSPFPQLPGVPPTTATSACTVPKVNGRSLTVAKRRLTASGCTRATTVTRRYSNTVPKGRVIGTSPGSGARTTKKVKLIVSKGKRPKRAKAAQLLLVRQRSSIAGISA